MKLQLHDWRVKKVYEDTLLVMPKPKSKRRLKKICKYAQKLRRNNSDTICFFLNNTNLSDFKFGVKLYYEWFDKQIKQTPWVGIY
jgi:hypothetical protein